MPLVHFHGLLPFMVSPLSGLNACTDGTGDTNDSQIEIVPSDSTKRCHYNCRATARWQLNKATSPVLMSRCSSTSLPPVAYACTYQTSGQPRAATKTPAIASSALVYAALALDELVQGLGIGLVRRRVPHKARPLAPRSFVGLGGVRGAPNDGCERVFPLRYLQPLQTQSPASSVDLPSFRCPNGDQAIDGGQVAIDRVAVAVGLAVFPGVSRPLQVLPLCCRRVRDGLFWRRSWLKCLSIMKMAALQ
jgi:hypothetical protein